jgi:ABC-type multidrug transport system ATPase subunit
MIVVNNVSVRYGKVVALTDVSFSLSGRLIGVLGENGAGKTTLFTVLAGARKPQEGSVTGLSRITGYAPQEISIPKGIRVEDFLTYLCWLQGVKGGFRQRVDEALGAVELADKRRARVGELSGGMLRRLQFAQSLLADPGLLLLDEPTAGLDPVQRTGILDLVERLSAKTQVMLSTHIISDLAGRIDEVVVLRGGRVAALQSWNESRPTEAELTWLFLAGVRS